MDQKNQHRADVAARLYQILWCLWLLAFVTTLVLYCAYSVILIRILRLQLSSLNHVDQAINIIKKKETAYVKRQSIADAGPEKRSTASAHAVHQMTTGLDIIGVDETLPVSEVVESVAQEETEVDASHPEHRRRQSWFQRRASWFNQQTNSKDGDIASQLKQYSKLDLLRLNTRLIIMEAVLFSFFCFAWW